MAGAQRRVCDRGVEGVRARDGQSVAHGQARCPEDSCQGDRARRRGRGVGRRQDPCRYPSNQDLLDHPEDRPVYPHR